MQTKKIGGWLILLGLQIAIQIFHSVYLLNEYFKAYLSGSWNKLESIKGGNELLYFFYFDMSISLFILVICPLIFNKYLNRKKEFKDYYTIYMFLLIILTGTRYWLASNTPLVSDEKLVQYLSPIGSLIIWTPIWIIYLFKGKRPSMTFIN